MKLFYLFDLFRTEEFSRPHRDYEHGAKEVHDMVEVRKDYEVGSKRKLRSPMKEIVLEEDVGKKQKIDGEVLVLSKLMAQQLGLAVATGQHRWE